MCVTVKKTKRREKRSLQTQYSTPSKRGRDADFIRRRVDETRRREDELFLTMIGQYTTQKQVLIKSKNPGVLYYFLVACVSVYIVGFLLYREHGYQKTVPAEGVLAIKVKGTAATNDTQTGEKRVYDANDLVQYSSDGAPAATRLVNTRQRLKHALGVSQDVKCGERKEHVRIRCIQSERTTNRKVFCRRRATRTARIFVKLKVASSGGGRGRRRVAVGISTLPYSFDERKPGMAPCSVPGRDAMG